MPSATATELIGFLLLIFAIWFVLKLAKAAIKLTLFILLVAIVAGVVYFLFLR